MAEFLIGVVESWSRQFFIWSSVVTSRKYIKEHKSWGPDYCKTPNDLHMRPPWRDSVSWISEQTAKALQEKSHTAQVPKNFHRGTRQKEISGASYIRKRCDRPWWAPRFKDASLITFQIRPDRVKDFAGNYFLKSKNLPHFSTRLLFKTKCLSIRLIGQN